MTFSAEQAAELADELMNTICEAEEPDEDDERAVRVNLDWLHGMIVQEALSQQAAPGVAGEMCHRQFEIYAASQGHRDFEQNEFGNYKNPAVQGDYWIWIASREAMVSQNGAGEFCTVINDDKSKCQRENRHCGYPSCIASQPHPTGDTQQEAIYQANRAGAWEDISKETYEETGFAKRIVFTHPPEKEAI